MGRLRNWQDDQSWRVFFDTYWKLIYSFALKRGLTPTEAEDAVQETVVAVAKSIATFEYKPEVCAFKTWLLNVTRSKIANQFARRRRHPTAVPEPNGAAADHAGSARTALVERIPDGRSEAWEQSWEEEWERNLLEKALERIRLRVRPDHYQIFHLHAVQGFEGPKIARMLRVSESQVYVVRHRLAAELKREIERLRDKPF